MSEEHRSAYELTPVRENPSIAIGPLMLIAICYGSGVKLPWKLPVGLGALSLGTALAFSLYYIGLPSSVSIFVSPQDDQSTK